MGKALFGKQEDLTCIMDVAVQGAQGEPLCLAYKTTTFHFVAGVHLRDDGYVLKVKAKDAFYPLTQAMLHEQQDSGGLPTPLPAYSISLGAYAWGYFLWIAILGVVVWGVVARKVREHRRAAEAAMLASVPVHLGPPQLRTDADRFIHEQVRPLLRPDERVQHQAYGLAGGPASPAFFAVLTNERLLLVQTRVGAFAVLLENHGVEAFERSTIGGVDVDGETITLGLLDGRTITITVGRRVKKLSNQVEFVRDVPRILGGALAVPAIARVHVV